jgi:3-dehydroshikimate dehydratase
MNGPRAGLVTVTFRNMTAEEIVRLAAANGLTALEWGGDIHVPPGDLARAAKVASLARGAGLPTICYGSYYRVGHGGENGASSFAEILQTAEALGAPVIRVWPGNRGSADADAAYYDKVCADAVVIAGAAAERGIRVAFELHGGTLTDTPASARRLYAALDHPNIFALWQPLSSLDRAAQDESLEVVLPRLAHVHVLHWRSGPVVERRPLHEGRSAWSAWMARIAAAGSRPDYLLEFVRGEDPAQLGADAASLRGWLAGGGEGGSRRP